MTRARSSEMSRPIQVDRIPAAGMREVLQADADELQALATRFGLPSLHALTAELALARWRGNGVKVTGLVTADIEQVCVVSLEPFRTEMREAVERYFIPRAGTQGTPDRVLEDAEIDIFDHGTIDVGEMACEIVALGLDPYPRRPGIAFASTPDRDISARDAPPESPFAALEALKKRRQ